MSLDNVILSPDALRLLYPRSLVSARAEAPERPRTEESSADMPAKFEASTEVIEPPRYMGKNAKRVLILVKDDSSAFLDEKSFTFLVSILNAVHLSMDDVALVNAAALSEAKKAALPEQLESRIVMVFGSVSQPPGERALYEVVASGGRSFLYSAPLSAVAADRATKGRLWGALKQLFQL